MSVQRDKDVSIAIALDKLTNKASQKGFFFNGIYYLTLSLNDLL